MALSKTDALKLIERRSPEWVEHERRWRWLLDSLEGGERYRQAVYGSDRHGWPLRNLIRHKREYPDPRELAASGGPGAAFFALGGTAVGPAGFGAGTAPDQAQYAEDDDYELRRARTPVPTFVKEAVDVYCSKIFASEIHREASASDFAGLRDWWEDVDGLGTRLDDWMKDMVGPLILTLGHLDICFDHPAIPAGTPTDSVAQALAAGVDRCVASYILPENMLWWPADDSPGSYSECLVQEYVAGDESRSGTGLGPRGGTSRTPVNYRHWTARGWTLYDDEGSTIAEGEHRFGRVPIVRVFDRRKPRCRNVGQSFMEPGAEIQREVYNRGSELILSDTTQAHPLMQGPVDLLAQDSTIAVGPNRVLPMYKITTGAQQFYQGWSVIDFPKGAADSLRANITGLRDEFDRLYGLTKPAGASGTGRTTVAQSGISKQIDHDVLHSRLASVSKMFQKAELRVAEFVMTVLTDGNPPEIGPEDVKVTYPTVFSLYAADELSQIALDFQTFLAQAGDCPEVEIPMASAIALKVLPGHDDETYKEYDIGIERTIMGKAQLKAEMAEAGPAMIDPAQLASKLEDQASVEFAADSPPAASAGGGARSSR